MLRLEEKIVSGQEYLEKKIKNFTAQETQIALCASQVKKVGDLMLKSKEELSKDHSEMRKDFSKV